MIVPNDAILLMSTLVMKMSDDMLAAATAIKEQPELAESVLVDPLVRVNDNVGRLQAVLKIIVDENKEHTKEGEAA